MVKKEKSETQSPVINRLACAFIINIQIKMTKTSVKTNAFEETVQYIQANPLDFKALAQIYDIAKLQLEKFTAFELREKKIDLQQRYHRDTKDVSKVWLENQYRLFIWFLLSFSKMISREPKNFTNDDWNLIASTFQKEPIVCQYFYLCSTKMKQEPWLPHEDSLIISKMRQDSFQRWTDIGLELFRTSNRASIRKPKCIRERWLSHLNPQIQKSDWTFTEELFLVEKIKQIGKKWSKIAKLMGNRSQHSVKNRFNKMIQKIKRKLQNNYCGDNYSEEDIFELLLREFKKSKEQKQKSKEINQKQSNYAQQLALNLLQFKLQNQLTDQNFRMPPPTQIFQPIVIIFKGINL